MNKINKALIELKGVNRDMVSFTFLERLELTPL